jgi:hypothetical protein
MWTKSGIRDASGSEAARRLFTILEELVGKASHKLPYPLQRAKPFLLAREFGRRPRAHPGETPGEYYAFQLGPRSWSKSIYSFRGRTIDASLPDYEQEAEKLAMALQEAAWEQLGKAIFELTFGPPPGGAAELVRPILSVQEDGRFFAVHSPNRGKAVAFDWMDDGFRLLGEAHPAPLIALASAPRMPIISLEAGTTMKRDGRKAGQMDALRAEIAWRYATRIDPVFDGLLLEASDRLREVDGDVGIAFAQHRFNDACGDDSWLAARAGNYAWENGAYFRANAASLRAAPPEIDLLLGLLAHLQACRLELHFERAYGYPVHALDVLGLFREQGAYYFACCNSNGCSGPVYAIDRTSSGSTSLFGFTPRYDWNFNNGSRAGGLIPQANILETVAVDEVIRTIETGEIPIGGPPHDLDVPWHDYLPKAG